MTRYAKGKGDPSGEQNDAKAKFENRSMERAAHHEAEGSDEGLAAQAELNSGPHNTFLGDDLWMTHGTPWNTMDDLWQSLQCPIWSEALMMWP